jgi:transcriptional regulator GlxA family with amidase domain
MFRSPTTIQIGVLIYPECAFSTLAIVDVFQVANAMSKLRPADEHVLFETKWVSPAGGVVACSGGMSFSTKPLIGSDYDVVIVPGMVNGDMRPLLRGQLEAQCNALRLVAEGGGMIASHCSGSFLMAKAGLLDGRRATTSWWLDNLFRKHFPAVELDTEELISWDGPFLSSGPVTAYADLGLWLIGHFAGESLRQMSAKVMAADSNRSSQAPYISEAIAASSGYAVVERARRWLNERIDQQWSMTELAEYCNASPRTLLRRFQKAVGLSPVRYAQKMRVERGRALLESTMLSLEDITERCGYADVSTFSTVFKRWTQVTPREYRSRFGLRA